MSKWFLSRGICAAVVVMALFALVPMPTAASHVWSTYHWQRTSSAIRNIPVRRFHSAAWITRFNTAMTDWKKPAMTKVRPTAGATGGGSNTCPPLLNQITSCDGSYGNTGWLGLASVWTFTGTAHIAQGTSKVNNTYFNTAAYNTVAFRQSVICQEIGHNFGLGHVNEVFNNANVGSCMDYTNDPDGGAGGGSQTDPNNMHPYAHDYALINSRHTHIGSILPGLAPQTAEMPLSVARYNPMKLTQLGALVSTNEDGRLERYEIDLGAGWKVTNFVIRAR